MSDEKPIVSRANENIGGLDDGFVETVSKRGRDVFGAGDPADIAFDADPDGAEGDANAFCIRKNASPASANFVPA